MTHTQTQTDTFSREWKSTLHRPDITRENLGRNRNKRKQKNNNEGKEECLKEMWQGKWRIASKLHNTR